MQHGGHKHMTPNGLTHAPLPHTCILTELRGFIFGLRTALREVEDNCGAFASSMLSDCAVEAFDGTSRSPGDAVTPAESAVAASHDCVRPPGGDAKRPATGGDAHTDFVPDDYVVKASGNVFAPVDGQRPQAANTSQGETINLLSRQLQDNVREIGELLQVNHESMQLIMGRVLDDMQAGWSRGPDGRWHQGHDERVQSTGHGSHVLHAHD